MAWLPERNQNRYDFSCSSLNPAALQFVLIWMNKDEFTKKLTKINQIMDELIYGLMQTGMTDRQAEEEVFTMLKRMRVSKETKDDWED